MPLSRYREIIPDFDGFLAACQRPLPICVWTNPLRADPAQVEAALIKAGAAPTPSRIHGAFLSTEDWRPGNTLSYFRGEYHVQEEVAQLAVPALNPKPGQRILDLCAAPGNKTAQIAIAMQNKGTLIANERRHDRLKALRGNLERLGVFNTATILGDGAGIPLLAGPFDGVLADVPCTCEGTLRRNPKVAGRATARARLKISRTQGHLLRRAIRLTRPGGVVVYATCTFAPEENEAVVQSVLGDQGRVVPFDSPLPSAPGLSQYNGETFREDLRHARRFYPHLSNTGGFFIARILVDRPDPGRTKERGPVNTYQRLEAADATALWTGRFGVPPEVFQGFQFIRRGAKVVWACPVDTEPGPHLLPESVGMAISRMRGAYAKPTTNAILSFGPHATRNVVDLDDAQADAFVRRGIFAFDAGDRADDGFVIVRYHGAPLGCGLYLDGRISSQLSKGRMLHAGAQSR